MRRRITTMWFYLSIAVTFFCITTVHSSFSRDVSSKETSNSEELDTGNTTPYDVNNAYIEPVKVPLTEDVNCDCGDTSFVDFELGFQGLLSSRKENKASLEKNQKFVDTVGTTVWVIDGVRVNRGEIPWMVAITKYQHKKTPRWKVICGGTVLNQKYILTAAHCIHERYKDTLEVVFNVDDATQISNDSQVLRRKINRFIIHPDFNSKTIDSDIALIELKVPVDLSKDRSKVRPICLPSKSHHYYVNKEGTVSGWGYTSYKGPGSKGENSPNLLKTTLPILSHQACLATKVPSKNNVTKNMFCAGYPKDATKDACINDSGGPLTVQDGDKSYIVGIVSWGIGCSLKDYPGVYTKVANFLPWIKENTKSGEWCTK